MLYPFVIKKKASISDIGEMKTSLIGELEDSYRISITSDHRPFLSPYYSLEILIRTYITFVIIIYNSLQLRSDSLLIVKEPSD